MKTLRSILLIIFCFLTVLLLVNPSPVTIKAILLFFGLLFFAFAPEKFLIYVSVFMVLFPVHLRFLGKTSNGIIIILTFMLCIKYAFTKKSAVALTRIINNPFFVPGLLIMCSYCIAFILAITNHSPGMVYHTEFLMSIGCAILFAFIITGFINSSADLFGIQMVLLAVLLLNLSFALVTLVFPGLKFVLLNTSGSVEAGSGSDYALRLGGMTFHWEAYAEFLMMAVVVLFAMVMRMKLTQKLFYPLSFLLFIVIVELLLTNTRGAVLTASVGVGLLVMTNSRINIFKRFISLGAASGVTLLGVAVGELFGKLRLQERFQSFGQMVSTKYGPMPVARAGAWLPSMERMVADHFLGTGPSFVPISVYMEGYGKLGWPHNLPLMILTTVGFYGMLAYLFLFARFFMLRKHIKRITDTRHGIFLNGLWFALLMFFVDSLKFDGALREPTSYFYFIWMLVAVCFSSVNLST